MISTVTLTGFMGTGKTAVGREVARRLDVPFVDMDAEIEARAGKPIPRIFSEDGETAFREMEAMLVRELSAYRGGWSELGAGAVIATGGGALVDPENLALMRKRGTVICLDAEPDEILRRVSDSGERPLLEVDDPGVEIERLQAARREAYAAIPWHIDTTGLSVQQVAARVIALVEGRTLSVQHPNGAYKVRIGEGLLNHVGGALRAAGVPPGTRVALVSNGVVAPLYASQVEEALHVAGLRPFLCVIPDGEAYKTLATVASLYDQFLAGRLDRSGTVLALGGGVTGDIAGFAAATFMRGVRFAQVPTSLLAMVDASVGGKTGVDLPQGKNLVGAFKQPACVTVDPTVLETLEEAEFRSGMAEVIKHSVIADPDLFAELEEPGGQSTSGSTRHTLTPAQIARALRVKIDIVEEDPYEQGRRAVLNLGHTVGHALEKLSDFELRHGEAVSVGMVVAARIAVRLGLADSSVPERLEAVLAAWDLPLHCRVPRWPQFQAGTIWQAMAHDKKRRGDTLRWVLPLTIGEVTIADDVPRQTVLAILRELGAA
jgi:shikimate kinase/3-dehydroquinate synthase